MPDRSERPGQVAGDGPHVDALAGLGLEDRMVGVGDVLEGEPQYLGRTRREIRFAAGAREGIGAPPRDLDGREPRRNLHDRPGEGGQRRPDRGLVRSVRAGPRRGAVEVVAVALLAPAHGEPVELHRVDGERYGLGRLAQGDRQYARRHRVERAPVARPRSVGEAPDPVADGRGCDSGGFVDDQPAVRSPPRPPPPTGHFGFPGSASRPGPPRRSSDPGGTAAGA